MSAAETEPPAIDLRPPLLSIRSGALFESFIGGLQSVGVSPPSAAEVRRIATQTIEYLKQTKGGRAQTEVGQQLFHQWYASLEQGKPDWSIYATDYYLAELWACWVVYSRRYLASMLKPSSLPPNGIIAEIGPVANVVDLGCGIGYTTLLLRQIYPTANVWATNFGSTVQTTMASRLGRQVGFSVAEDAWNVKLKPGPTLVFASEYFEHLPAPIAHAEEIVAALDPNTLVVANSFTARSIGHFDRYEVGNEQVDGLTASKRFAKRLRQLGYWKMQAKLWNNRPTIWRRP